MWISKSIYGCAGASPAVRLSTPGCKGLISFCCLLSGFLSSRSCWGRVKSQHIQDRNEESLKDSSSRIALHCCERVTDYIQSSSELIARKSYQSKSLWLRLYAHTHLYIKAEAASTGDRPRGNGLGKSIAVIIIWYSFWHLLRPVAIKYTRHHHQTANELVYSSFFFIFWLKNNYTGLWPFLFLIPSNVL